MKPSKYVTRCPWRWTGIKFHSWYHTVTYEQLKKLPCMISMESVRQGITNVERFVWNQRERW